MIFPTLQGQPKAEVNLNLLAIEWFKEHPIEEGGQNPFLDPESCEKIIADHHKKLGIAYSYGGWMEDRGTLWKGSYLDEQSNYMHVGIDINALADTPIAMDMHGEVVRIDDDFPEEGGWGPRVIVRLTDSPFFLIYAHLNESIGCKVGDMLSPGTIFASIGRPPHNGGWFPHLHVQVLSPEAYATLADNAESIDGYVSKETKEEAVRLFPDPLLFIRFD